MPAPGRQLYIEPVGEVVSGAFELDVCGRIGESERASPQVVPGCPDVAAGVGVAEVDHDQPSALAVPGPGHEIDGGLVAGPPRAVAEFPGAGAEGGVLHGR